MEKKRKSFAQRVKSGLWKILVGTTALHVGTQLLYTGNIVYHSTNPSPLREEFRDTFGYEITGWYDDIEAAPKHVTFVANVLEKERASRDFSLRSFRISDSNYFKRNLFDQVGDFIVEPYSGACVPPYLPFSDTLIISQDNVNPDTIHHECKHAKAYDVYEHHPEFLEQWKALAVDSNGKTLYYESSDSGFYSSRVSCLDLLVDTPSRKKVSSEDNEKLGFISNYARTHVDEDVAELCQEVETNPERFARLLFGETKNDVIAKKVSLAQKYRLISPDFTEVLTLHKLLDQSFDPVIGSISTKRAQPFMHESYTFLEEHPNSVYTSQLRESRAYILFLGSRGYSDSHSTLDDAIHEYKAVLTASYKDTSAYANALHYLEKLYTLHLFDEETGHIFADAYTLFWEQYHSGSATLSRDGVNDYLISHGIDLD